MLNKHYKLQNKLTSMLTLHIDAISIPLICACVYKSTALNVHKEATLFKNNIKHFQKNNWQDSLIIYRKTMFLN